MSSNRQEQKGTLTWYRDTGVHSYFDKNMSTYIKWSVLMLSRDTLSTGEAHNV